MAVFVIVTSDHKSHEIEANCPLRALQIFTEENDYQLTDVIIVHRADLKAHTTATNEKV